MTAYDDEKTNLKSLFGDNKYPTGANFSELINLSDYRLAENNNGTITVNGITYDMTKTDLGSIAMVSADFDTLPNGLSFVAFGQTNAPESTSAYWVRTLSSSAYNGRKLQVAKADITNSCYFRTNSSNSWSSWETIATQTMLNNKVTDNKDGSITVNGSTFVPADNSKVVHTTDMRKPASDVVGLEDVSTAINRGVIASGTDLDTITQEGIYVLGGHSFANFVDTDVHWGTLTVTNQDGMTTQLAKCTSNIGDQIFFRTKSGNPVTWYPWRLVSVGAHIQASNNDEDSAISDSAKGNADDIYYWTE